MKFNFILLVLMIALASVTVSAQEQPQLLPFRSWGGGPFDSVNLGSLDVMFSIPVLHKAGRGMPFAYDIWYNSAGLWTPVTANGVTQWQPSGSFGWNHISNAGMGSYISYTTSYSGGSCPINPPSQMGTYSQVTYSSFVYHDSYGFTHYASGSVSYIYNETPGCTTPPSGPLPPTAQSMPIYDATGLTLYAVGGLNSPSAYIVTRDGSTINPPVSSSPSGGSWSAPDRNGNQITETTGSWTDTTGVQALALVGTAPSNTTLTYVAPSGANASYTVSYTSYTVQTYFQSGTIREYGPTSNPLVTAIQRPDGTSYSFTYEQTPSGANCTPLQGTSGCVTGRLHSVILPTGGSITYTYGSTQSDGTVASLTRALSSPGGTWTYTRSLVSGNHWTTTVTSPTLDNTVIDFMKDSAGSNFFETQRVVNQLISGTQTPLLTATTCWNGTSSNCTTTGVTSPITQRAVTLQYPSGGQQTKSVAFYNNSGLVTETDAYSYGTGAPGSLLRKTVISYASLGNSIVDRPASVIVYDGSNNVLSKTTYTYDEYSSYPLQVTSGTPQHGSVTGSRGNVTTISSAVSWNPTTQAVSSWLTRHFQYYDTGNIYRSQDVNGQWTSYNYSNSTSTCGNSFPTSVALPITGLSTSATYNCTGAVAATAIDLNANTTTSNYSDSSFWRPASIVAPYTPTSTTTTSLTYSSTTIDSLLQINGGSSVAESLTTVGAFGQVLYSQQREGPSSGNWDSTQVIYDSFLRPYQSTMPCVTTSGSGCGSAAKTAKTFDALGRVTQITDGGNPTPGWVKYTYTQNDVLQEVGPQVSGENTKQRQLEYDALGRLVSVCEKTAGLSGYGVCSQNTSSPNGYLTTYAYDTTTINSLLYTRVTVTQNAQAATGHQTRTYVYDLLGRLSQETNPENGTTAYTYDSDSAGTCTGTYTGDLVKRTDAKGNKMCYQYDAIHRNTQITYPTGPDGANTPTKTFVYDAATLNGTAMSNAKGRLSETYTGAAGSKTTDEFFSYSVRGEVAEVWECTPHSASNGCASGSIYYYSVSASYWENGALKLLTPNLGSLTSITYGVDSMGRTSTVTAGSGQNPVTSTSYNLSAFTASVTFGSGDSDTFYLDPNTGRQTKYVFNVNGATNTGQTTWNPNGSLQTLQITDNVPGASDTQTCNFSHDDLARISSVGCVNGSTTTWTQTFVYDAFGNISKTSTGPGITFPGSLPSQAYSSSTNWLTSVSGCVGSPTFDSNGQMTYDCTHNYTWDSEGKMHSVDASPSDCSTSGQCATYDALGRMVEKRSGSTYTQIVYGPGGGRLATMSGQGLTKAFIPLPGGATAVYDYVGLAYYRHADHLGSSRLATTPSRTRYSSTAYAPFGEEYTQTGTTDLSFTGQEQDTVAGMYDFLVRKYSPVQGRWLSPDPAGIGSEDPADPQSFNRYAYVRNSPLVFTDPLGLNIDAGRCSGDSYASGCGGSGGGCDPNLMDCGSSGGSPSSPGQGGTSYYDLTDGMSIPASEALQLLYSGGASVALQVNLAAAAGTTMTLLMPDGSYVTYTVGPNNTWLGPNGEDVSSAISSGELQLPSLDPVPFWVGIDISPIRRGGASMGGIDIGALQGGPFPVISLNAMNHMMQCADSAMENSAVPLGQDALGFVPGEGVAHSLFGIGVGMVSTTTAAMKGDTPGAMLGIAGMHASALEGTSKVIPVAGFFLNVVATGHDFEEMGHEFNSCLSGD